MTILHMRQRELLDQLGQIRRAGLYPFKPTIIAADGPRCVVADVGEALMFASCDYLGLSQHVEVKQAAAEAVLRFGTNTYGAQIYCGYTDIHAALEAELTRLYDKGGAILFPSGMAANIGVIGTLAGRKDVIIHDRLNHVSLFMGSELAGATQRSYRHLDMGHLEKILAECGNYERRLIVTDGVFSADGDLAPIAAICDLARRFDATVLVDEAHSAGVFGATGAGVAEHQRCLDRVDVVMGTMSKAFGSVGGFVTGDAQVVDVIRHTAAAYTSSRGSPPATAAASLAALMINRREGETLRARLHANIRFALDALRGAGFDYLEAQAASIPVRIGDQQKVMAIGRRLLEQGFVVSAMVPPSVPPGGARLRIGITAQHDIKMISALVRVMSDAWNRC